MLTAALENENATPPIDSYLESLSIQRAAITATHPVARGIKSSINGIMKGSYTNQKRTPERITNPPNREIVDKYGCTTLPSGQNH